MIKYTVDQNSGYGLPAFFELNEKFTQDNISMLRLVYIAEGNGILKLNNETIVFSAPSLFCINELDHLELQQFITSSAQAVYFHPVIINDSLNLDAIRNKKTKLSITDYRDYFLITSFVERKVHRDAYIEIGQITSKRVSQLFKSMKEELTFMESEFWQCRFRSFLLETLFLIQNMIT